ncbi:MAG: threonine ammonia-lyase, partial [Nannocystaceae bacterium]
MSHVHHPPRPFTPSTAADAEGLRRAAQDFWRWCPPSPLHRSPVLDAFVGCETWVKCEHLLPTGAFKIRGATHLLAEFARHGVRGEIVAASRGNHGQALARACLEFGRRCTIFVPFGNSALKDRRMRALGARVVMWGDSFDDAARGARAYAHASGAHLVNPGDTPALVHGNSSMGLELAHQLEQMGLLDTDAVLAPVGVGSCAAALGLGLRAAGWAWPLVGAQSDRAPAMHEAWHRGQRTPRAVGPTVADGLAVGEPPRYTSGLLRQVLDGFQLVDEASIVEAMEAFRLAWGTPEPEDPRRVGLARLHGVVEGAG